MTDVRLERSGEVIADNAFSMPYAGAVSLLADLSQESEFVFDGCGEEVRIPVVHSGAVGPTIDDYCDDDGAFAAKWAPASSDNIAMLFQHFEPGFQCRAPDDGQQAFPPPIADAYYPELEIQHPLDAYESSVGRFDLFEIRPAPGGFRKVNVPRNVDGDLYGLPTQGASGVATFEIDGVASQQQDLRILVAEAGLADADPSARVHLEVETESAPTRTIRLTTSPITDMIEVEIESVTYTAEVTHSPPAVGIRLEPAVDERYEVSQPATIMQDALGNTKSVAFDLTYDVGFLATPCAWR